MQEFLHSPIAHILAVGTSVAFTAVAAAVPPNAGNLVAGIFVTSFASYLGGEEDPDTYEQEISDEDL
jgi:hypothetical protein